MPTLKVPDGEIHYEVHGSGYPLTIFAPGGHWAKGIREERPEIDEGMLENSATTWVTLSS
jgi:hypothetical protein